MDRDEAFRILERGNARERLESARYLELVVRPEDEPRLKDALRSEDVSWVRSALHRALQAIGVDQSGQRLQLEVDVATVSDDIYADAIEETTGRLVHEINPIVGAIRVYAEQEFENFSSSNASKELQRLDKMLEAIDVLSRVASAPTLEEFNLAQLLRDLVEATVPGADQSVEFIGPDPLLVWANQALLSVCLRNALANAVQAANEADQDLAESPLIVSWDETDTDYWVAVLDRGRGLPPARSQILEIGSTTKEGHLGMGLALADRAARSLRGDISLADREGGGVRFELRWPRPPGDDTQNPPD
jgi:signal transduction histidine kinase